MANRIGSATHAIRLSGQRIYPPVPSRGFLGFAADPQRPCRPTPCRRDWLYEQNHPELRLRREGGLTPRSQGLLVLAETGGWIEKGTNHSPPCCPIVYFRAENSNYTIDGLPPTNVNADGFITSKPQTNAKSQFPKVWPAFDTRLSNGGSFTFDECEQFPNPLLGARHEVRRKTMPRTTYCSFPAGWKYDPETYDDITNFSGGTLENAKP